jgi:predicted O-linked N-acetylglucosamine transferase (SPINDLY family)
MPIARDAPIDTNPSVTFGAFTQIAKLTAPMRLLWAQILQQTPYARLVVAGVADERARATLLEALALDGVHPSRVVLLPFMPVKTTCARSETSTSRWTRPPTAAARPRATRCGWVYPC